jgi:hypothetical protein
MFLKFFLTIAYMCRIVNRVFPPNAKFDLRFTTWNVGTEHGQMDDVRFEIRVLPEIIKDSPSEITEAHISTTCRHLK